MGGIAPVDGVYVRPLLCLKRKEIESYLAERGISYCTDETNLEDDYTRNRIRSHVIPYLEEQINQQTVEHMADTMEQMRKLGEFVEQETRRHARQCIRYVHGNQAILNAEAYGKAPEALQAYMIHEMLCQIAGRRKDIESAHVRAVMELIEKQVGRRVDLPYHMQARRCYEGIVLSKTTDVDTIEDISAEEPATFRIFERQSDIVIFPKKTYTKWFDYDIIKNTVKIRHRAPGDYLTIDKNGGTQKLKQYFVNEKIPREERDQVWLVADGSEIMWIVGYRQNQKYQVTEHTRRIMEIHFHGGKKDGREH